VGLQLRLIDRFGDNGVIAIVIGRMQPDQNMLIETWLMSCRVLGRQVEVATLTLLAQEARKLGARQLIGEYIPTKKNGIVQDHYVKLGFTVVCTNATGGCRNMLDLESFRPVETSIAITKG
jgi:FkbH-like protein